MYEFGSVSISVFIISDGYEAKRGGEKEDLPSMSSLWLYKLWSFRINVKIKFHISGGNFPPEIYIPITVYSRVSLIWKILKFSKSMILFLKFWLKIFGKLVSDLL